MIEKLQLLPGVSLSCYRDTRFKQGCLSFHMIRMMSGDEAASNALLPSVLLRGTRQHPDLRSVTEHLDTLYGASISAQVQRLGDYQSTGFYCGFMDDRFALPGDRVLEPMIRFLGEILLEPLTRDGAFLPEIVAGEKKNLIATIESELNDKRVYAMNRLLKTMCRGDSFSLPRLGEKEQVTAITPESLYTHYRRVLRESPIHIFYVGSSDCAHVARLLQPVLARLDRTPVSLPESLPFRGGEQSHLTETLEVAQGKLCMGFTTSVSNRSPEFPAMQLFNSIFGAGMTSKLFTVVREQMSLCYSVGSGYYGSKGIMTVSAGIDFDKEELTRREILHQLQLCRDGAITEAELKAAKAALLSSLRSVHDSPGAIENYYAARDIAGTPFTVAEYMAAVEAATVSDVVAAANTVTLHSSFFLKGGSQ